MHHRQTNGKAILTAQRLLCNNRWEDLHCQQTRVDMGRVGSPNSPVLG